MEMRGGPYLSEGEGLLHEEVVALALEELVLLLLHQEHDVPRHRARRLVRLFGGGMGYASR